MSSSILTNSSAMTALQNLASTQKSLNMTQAQISSGLKVATASDNAAYWSIATTLKSDTGALSAVSDALNLGSSVVSTATAAITSTLTLLNKIKADLVTAQQPGASTTAVQTDIKAQQQSLIAVLSSANFNGVNLLDGSVNTNGVTQATFVSSFTRTTSGSTSTTSVQTLNINTQSNGTQVAGANGILAAAISYTGTAPSTSINGTAGTGTSAGNYAAGSLLAIDITTASAGDLAKLQSAVDGLIGSVTTSGTTLGTASSVITNQQSYVQSLSNAVTSGVGSLVDADMNLASTRLQALQTQQQLGIQALSIANQNSQLILKLFGQ